MPRVERANFDRLLRSAWERQISLRNRMSSSKTKAKILDTGLFVTIVGVVGMVFIALLQWNGVIEVEWFWSAVGYLLCILICLWALWRWEIIHHLPLRGKIFSLLACLVVLIIVSSLGVISQLRRKHPPKSVLTVKVLDTNISYPEGYKFAGIEWKRGYDALDVDVANLSDSAIQNIDVALRLEKGFIFAIGQTSDLSGVEFHSIDPFEDAHVKLRGADDRDSTITSTNMWALAGNKLPASQWKLFCPRLGGKTSLHLVLEISSNGKQSTKIRIFGNYELSASQNNRAVSIDMEAPITR